MTQVTSAQTELAPADDREVLVRSPGISKRSCRSLKKLLWYRLQDESKLVLEAVYNEDNLVAKFFLFFMDTPTITLSPMLLVKLQRLYSFQQKHIEDYVDFLIQKNENESKGAFGKEKKRVLGLNKGMMIMTDDFDEPLLLENLYV